jgi:hypothetical protein
MIAASLFSDIRYTGLASFTVVALIAFGWWMHKMHNDGPLPTQEEVHANLRQITCPRCFHFPVRNGYCPNCSIGQQWSPPRPVRQTVNVSYERPIPHPPLPLGPAK